MRDRTPTDYAMEHAEYLAKAAEGFIDECNELANAEMARDELCGDDGEAATKAADEKVWQAKEAISEGMGRLRDCIHEFRLRHGRAKVSQHDPAVAAATTQQKVLDAALQWWCERQINDWDEADLAHALIDHEGDWPGRPSGDTCRYPRACSGSNGSSGTSTMRSGTSCASSRRLTSSANSAFVICRFIRSTSSAPTNCDGRARFKRRLTESPRCPQ